MEYLSFDRAMREQFGTKVYKLALSSGCTCPNRDGTVGYGGCTFCSEGGSGEFAAPSAPPAQQIREARKRVEAKIPTSIPPEERRFIAYYQSFTNTYMPVDRLEAMLTDVMACPEIAAVSLGTRPDCLEQDKVELLGRLQAVKPVWIELGLQTVHDDTARAVHRGYPLNVFRETYGRLKAAGIPVIVHLIFGLPGEDRERMLESVRYLASLDPPPDGVKLQLLQILKGTALGEQFLREPFPVMSLPEYADLIVDALKILPPRTVIHRLTGDGPKRLLIAPLWCADKKRVLNTLRRRIAEA